MRTTLEGARASNIRQFATSFGSITHQLNGTYVISTSVEAPVVYTLDANGVNRIIQLPPLGGLHRERFIVISNASTVGSLIVQDAVGVELVTVQLGGTAIFFGTSVWRWVISSISLDPAGFLQELRQVTSAGAQVINATEPGLIINKAVASPTPVTLPLSATRGGRPVRFTDWRQNVDVTNPLTLTPTAPELIHNLGSWEVILMGGGVIVFPNATLGGWTVGG